MKPGTHLQLVKGVSETELTASYADERPILTRELIEQIVSELRIDANPLPDELMTYIKQLPDEKGLSYITFCNRYQGLWEMLINLLRERKSTNKQIAYTLEAFMKNVYFKVMERIEGVDAELLNKARRLVIVNGELDLLADKLAESIKLDFLACDLPGQLETIDQIKTVIG